MAEGVCMAEGCVHGGGHAWQGHVCQGGAWWGHAWQGACMAGAGMAGGVHRREVCITGACMVGEDASYWKAFLLSMTNVVKSFVFASPLMQ